MERPNGINRINSYDNDGRLTGIIESGQSSIALVRDGRGQIISAVRDLPLLTSATGLSNRIGIYDAASHAAGASYDSIGRLTSSAGDTYRWNLASRLTSYTREGVDVASTYDAVGLRISRASGAITHNYTWNYILGAPSISIEKQGAITLRYYVHTPGGRLLYSIEATTNGRRHYHYDEQGNTRYLTNDSGTTIASYSYGPFGEVLSSAGGLDNPFTWQGELGAMDENNGLFYIRARFYDSAAARFISRDPIAATGPRGINPYQYAYNNPLFYVDVTGMKPESELTPSDMNALGEAFMMIAKNGITGCSYSRYQTKRER